VSAEVVDLGTFTRQWAVEGRRVAWLLGAGASASANVPTASQITLDLLARLYAARMASCCRTSTWATTPLVRRSRNPIYGRIEHAYAYGEGGFHIEGNGDHSGDASSQR
jgi:hypothetical protein